MGYLRHKASFCMGHWKKTMGYKAVGSIPQSLTAQRLRTLLLPWPLPPLLLQMSEWWELSSLRHKASFCMGAWEHGRMHVARGGVQL